MPTLDTRAGRLDVLVHPGNAHSLVFTWPAALTGRTFTATLGTATALTVTVNGATVTVDFTEAQTAAVTTASWWKLTETTSGTQDRIVGKVIPNSYGTGDQDETITVTEDEVAITVTVLGEPGSGAIGDGDKGDITVSSSGTVWTVDNDTITNAKAANVATSTIKGRVTAGTGDPEDLTPTQARTVLGLGTAALENTGAFDAAGTAAAAVETHRDDTTNVHGITDTSALETTTGAQAKADAKVAQTITNGVTTSAPSQDAVFDALALKAPLASPTFTGNVVVPDADADTEALNRQTADARYLPLLASNVYHLDVELDRLGTPYVDADTDVLASVNTIVAAIETAGGGTLAGTYGRVYGLAGTSGDSNPHGVIARSGVTIAYCHFKALGDHDLNPGLVQHPDWDTALGRVDGAQITDFAMVMCELDCQEGVSGRTRGSVGFRLDGFDGLRLEDVTVRNTSSYGYAFQARVGEGSSGSLVQENAYIARCKAIDCGLDGFDGLDSKSGANWVVEDFYAEGCGNAGLNLRGENIDVRGGLAVGCTTGGLRLQRQPAGTASFTVDGFAATDCDVGIFVEGVAIESGNDPFTEQVIARLSGCRAWDNTTAGFRFSTGENFDLSVDGCISWLNGVGIDITATSRGRTTGATVTTTNGAATIVSSVNVFSPKDVGGTITGTGIPGATTILSVTDAKNATMSANASADGTVVVTITPTSGRAFRTANFAHVVSRNNTGDGINLAGGSTRWDCCAFLNNGGAGIDEDAAVADYVGGANNVVLGTCRSEGNVSTDTALGYTVASASTITLPKGSPRGDSYFEITGTTSISTINGGWPGRVVHLHFASTPTIGEGSGIRLVGTGNFTASSDDVLTLLRVGTYWVEISRSVN